MRSGEEEKEKKKFEIETTRDHAKNREARFSFFRSILVRFTSLMETDVGMWLGK